MRVWVVTRRGTCEVVGVYKFRRGATWVYDQNPDGLDLVELELSTFDGEVDEHPPEV